MNYSAAEHEVIPLRFMTKPSLENITCAEFVALAEPEQRAFILGVANGRGMVSGLFRAYAGAAQNFAETPEEKQAISDSFDTSMRMAQPVLEVDTQNLFNGVLAAAKRPDFQDQFVINALASAHLDIVKAIRAHAEQNGS